MNDTKNAPDQRPTKQCDCSATGESCKNKQPSDLLSPTANSIPLASAMDIVCAGLRDDLEYAWSWHCNIAMAAVDAGCPYDVANEGAARFMEMLGSVDTRKHPGFAGTQTSP